MAQATATRQVVFTPTSQKVGGIAGIVFAVLLAVDIFALPGPTFSDSITDVREFFVDNANLALAVGWLEAILLVFVLLFFAASLRDTLAWSEPVPTELPRLVFAGGIVAAAIGGAASIPFAAVAFADGAVDDALLRFVMYMDVVAYSFLFSYVFALMALAASVTILRTGALARWLGWLGIASGLLLVTGGLWVIGGDETGPFAIVEFAGLSLWLVWVLGTGVDMFRRSRAT